MMLKSWSAGRDGRRRRARPSIAVDLALRAVGVPGWQLLFTHLVLVVVARFFWATENFYADLMLRGPLLAKRRLFCLVIRVAILLMKWAVYPRRITILALLFKGKDLLRDIKVFRQFRSLRLSIIIVVSHQILIAKCDHIRTYILSLIILCLVKRRHFVRPRAALWDGWPVTFVNLDLLRQELGLCVYVIGSAKQLSHLELRHVDGVIHSDIRLHVIE